MTTSTRAMSSIAVYNDDRIKVRTLAAQLDVSPAEVVRRLLITAAAQMAAAPPQTEGK